MEKEEFEEFYSSIIKILEKLEREFSTISIEKVLYKMGFPKNYQILLTL